MAFFYNYHEFSGCCAFDILYNLERNLDTHTSDQIRQDIEEHIEEIQTNRGAFFVALNSTQAAGGNEQKLLDAGFKRIATGIRNPRHNSLVSVYIWLRDQNKKREREAEWGRAVRG